MFAVPIDCESPPEFFQTPPTAEHRDRRDVGFGRGLDVIGRVSQKYCFGGRDVQFLESCLNDVRIRLRLFGVIGRRGGINVFLNPDDLQTAFISFFLADVAIAILRPWSRIRRTSSALFGKGFSLGK